MSVGSEIEYIDEFARDTNLVIKRLFIRGFKSIKDIVLDVKPGINLLVGPNGGGKTNILEAIYFLSKALYLEAGKIPYMPHAPDYWSAIDIIYEKDANSTVSLGIEYTFNYDYFRIEVRKKPHYSHVRFPLDVIYVIKFIYDLSRDTILPTVHEITINRDTVFTLSRDGVIYRIPKDVFDFLGGLNLFNKLLDRMGIDEKLNYEVATDSYIFRYEWVAAPSHPLTPIKLLNLFSALHIYFDRYGHFTGLKKVDGRKCLTLPIGFPYIKGIIPFIISLEKTYDKRIRSRSDLQSSYRMPSENILHNIIEITNSIIGKIILLKHPDMGSLGDPKPIHGTTRLDIRARNLAPILLILQGKKGGLPYSIERAIKSLFPAYKLKLNSSFGKVVLTVEENGLELSPSNIPDGFIKLISILTAVEQSPLVLLIDEIENSMHARMLEYIVDVLNSLDYPVLVATHSPVMVDLVDPERIILVYKTSEEGTKVERIGDYKQLMRKLNELGVSVSDYIFHHKT